MNDKDKKSNYNNHIFFCLLTLLFFCSFPLNDLAILLFFKKKIEKVSEREREKKISYASTIRNTIIQKKFNVE